MLGSTELNSPEAQLSFKKQIRDYEGDQNK